MLLHGWGGSDFPHWQSYIASELAKDYGCVNFVRFPDPDTPLLDRWKAKAKEEIESFSPDIVICHSLANTLWFHLCNQEVLTSKVQYLYLVAPPSMQCSIDELKTFFPVAIPKQLYAKSVKMIVSDNDPYITMEEVKSLKDTLQIEVDVLSGAGHINAQSGYGEWASFLEEIKSCQK